MKHVAICRAVQEPPCLYSLPDSATEEANIYEAREKRSERRYAVD